MHNEVLEDLVVVKRSGQRVSFNASKVALAIKKAFDSVGNADDQKIFKIFEKVLNYINDNYKDRKTINVEDIQDIIETTLYNEKCHLVYNSFKEYRQKRALSRKVFAEKQQHKFVKAIEKIEESSLNKDINKCADDLLYDFGKIISSEYAKSYILDTKSARASEEGNIYIHDLDYFGLGLFPKIHLKINKKMKRFRDVDDLINSIINVEREVYGEIEINNLDDILVEFLLEKYKSILSRGIKNYFRILGFEELINIKKIDEMIFSENSIEIDLSKYGSYILNERIKEVFVSAINDANDDLVKMCESIVLKVINSLEYRAERNTLYTLSFGLNDTKLGKMINDAIMEGFANKQYDHIRLIVKIDSINVDYINKLSNVIEIGNKVGVLFSKDKKLEYFSDGTKIYENNNSSSNYSNGRMVVSSTSINLARLGLKFSNKTKKEFYSELDNICDIVKNELLLSFETIGAKSKEYYRVLFNGNVDDDEKLEPGQKIRKVIKNGVLNIGVIGLKECVTCLEKNEANQPKLALEIINYLNDKCACYSSETKLNFGLHESTDNNARRRLLAIDKAIYGVVTGVTDKKKYDVLDLELFDNWKDLGNLQKAFTSGKKLSITLPKKITIKKLIDTLQFLKDEDIEFVRLVVGKDEY